MKTEIEHCKHFDPKTSERLPTCDKIIQSNNDKNPYRCNCANQANPCDTGIIRCTELGTEYNDCYED